MGAGRPRRPGRAHRAVLTTVDDFETQVLVGKNDNELIPQAAPGQRDGGGRAAGRPGRGGDADHRARAGAAAAPWTGGAGPHLRPAQADPRRGIRLGSARCRPAWSGCRPTACASTCERGSTSGTCAGSTPPTSPRSAPPAWRWTSSTDNDLEDHDEGGLSAAGGRHRCRPVDRRWGNGGRAGPPARRGRADRVVRPVRRPRPVPLRQWVPARWWPAASSSAAKGRAGRGYRCPTRVRPSASLGLYPWQADALERLGTAAAAGAWSRR